MKLDDFENDIEQNVGNQLVIDNESDEINILQNTAKDHSKRRKSITLRVHEIDLETIRLKASKAGIPYQTYINMLIHEDASRI